MAALVGLVFSGAVMGPVFPVAAHAQALFQAGELDQNRFVLVAAPIGKGERSQLNIYEQIRPTRACFSVGEGRPAAVNPLLASFDFTGICGRYIDANGYSVRVGGTDLATTYRLMVTRSGSDTVLLAVPTRGSGPEMVVARTGGVASGFLKLEFEPGWRLKRRQFGGRSLGHVYLYNDSVPTVVGSSSSSSPGPGSSPSPSPGQPSATAPTPPTPPSPRSPRGRSPMP
jgi:hypothetical protein